MAGLGFGLSGAAGGVIDSRNTGFDQELRARAQALQEDRIRQEMARAEEARQIELWKLQREAELGTYQRRREAGLYPTLGGAEPTPVSGVGPLAGSSGPQPGAAPGPRPISAVNAIEQFTGEPIVPEGPRAGAPPGGMPQPAQPAAPAAPGGTIDAGPVGQALPTPGPAQGAPGAPASMVLHGLTLGGQQVVPDEPVPIPNRQQLRAKMYQDAIDKFLTTPEKVGEGEQVWLGGRVVAEGGRKPMPGMEGAYMARLEDKLGRPLSFEELRTALAQYRKDNQDPALAASRELSDAIKQMQLQNLRENEVTTIKPGSNEDKLADMLSDGRMTIGQFRTAMGRGSNNKLRTAILVAASDKNPNFNPAAFEMGFSFARSPETQRAIAAVDNVLPNVNKIIQLSNSWDRTKFPDINKWIGTLQLKMGNQTVGNIYQAQKLVGDELALALGGGAMTDMKLELGLDVVNPNLSPEVFASNMERVVEFLHNRKLSLLGQMGPYGLPGMNPGAGAPIPRAVAKELANKADGAYDFDVDGVKTTFTVRNGNIYR